MEKVMIVTSAHPWDDERVFYKEARSLAKKYDLYLCAIADFEEKVIDNVKIYGLKKQKRHKRIHNHFEILKHIIKIKPKVVHFQDPDLLLLGLFLKIFMFKKIIYDVHEDYPLAFKNRHYIPKYLKGIFSWLFNFIEKFTSLWFDVVITVTDVIKNKFWNKNCFTIKNYPVLDNWIVKKDFVEKEELRLVYIGNVSVERGIDNIITAVKELNHLNLTLNIYGPFENKNYQEKLSMLNVKNISIFGRVPKSQIPEILNKNDVGFVTLLPYQRYIDSLPLKLFEYMAAGVAIIASNFPTWREIIESSESGLLVDPTDIDSIKQAIIYFYNNREEIIRMGQNGMKAIEKYNWTNEESKLYEVYNRILKK
ncbi:glycosyltransferase family 4 protein [Caldicellulosiruptoraceae bacterium PP1]